MFEMNKHTIFLYGGVYIQTLPCTINNEGYVKQPKIFLG